jgi:hypothetical protein
VLDALLEPRLRRFVEAEGLHHLAQDVVRGQVAVLELLVVRLDLGVDETPDHVADEQVLFAPFDHRGISSGSGG